MKEVFLIIRSKYPPCRKACWHEITYTLANNRQNVIIFHIRNTYFNYYYLIEMLQIINNTQTCYVITLYYMLQVIDIMQHVYNKAVSH